MATASAQTYGYARASALTDAGVLDLQTSGGTARSLGSAAAAETVAHPRFFAGLLGEAEPAAAAILGLANVAAAHYYRRTPTWLRDPVVTCDAHRLRFESFSACCGVYARLDVLPEAIDGEYLARGTTNIDGSVVERKVPLSGSVGVLAGPLRDCSRRVRGRFRGCRTVGSRSSGLVANLGRGVLAGCAGGGGRAGAAPVSSCWQLDLPSGMRFTLTLSPEANRGFSGEGAVLAALADEDVVQDAERIGALLDFQGRIDPDELAEQTDLDRVRIRAALSLLGTRRRLADSSHALRSVRARCRRPRRPPAEQPRRRMEPRAGHAAIREAARE